MFDMERQSPHLVFVVGAGASHEVGLPLGDGLKNSIVGLFNFPLGGDDRYRGDQALLDAFRSVDKPSQLYSSNSNAGVIAARSIAEGLPLAVSIDNFLDAHRANELTVTCGKLGIASAILESERNSHLIPADRYELKSKPNSANGTWFESLFRLLVEGSDFDGAAANFSKIAFICFNYDRCIEQFFVSALQWYFQVSQEKAVTAVARIEIVRPYGSVGPLLPRAGSDHVAYGAKLGAQGLHTCAARIRTFSEQSVESDDQERITKLVTGAKSLVFLGFAFHRINMKLLFPNQLRSMSTGGENVFATAYGLSQDTVGLIRDELTHALGVAATDCYVRPDIKCAGLFDEYGRKLSRSWFSALA
jgi:hypothetical protein